MDKASRNNLLHTLWQQVGCEYLSDMRNDARCNQQALNQIQYLDAREFSPEEWSDAVTYLTHGPQ